LADGRLEEALLWMQERHQALEDPPASTSGRSEFDYLTLARVLIAAGRASADASYAQQALSVLERLCVAAETAGRVRSLIEILGLQALAYHLEEESTNALSVLSRAVSLAEPGRYMRVFVSEGEPMSRLLRRLPDQQRTQKAMGQKVNLTYLSNLLKAFTHPGASSLPTSPTEGQPLLDPLSWREREVLRLLATGRRNREIADELVVVPGTIKAHINAIYQKLGYGPQTNHDEYYALAHLAAQYGVPTFTHVRCGNVLEPGGAYEGIAEVVAAAVATGAHMHVCPVNSTSLRHMDHVLEVIRRAQVLGLKITAEIYPYGAGCTA
jgi:LuxR family maltose regulon positive regulatory protein